MIFDWKNITQQRAEKRAACRRYRARRRNPNVASQSRASEAFYGVYQPNIRTLYANGIPSTAAGVGALLDALLQMDRGLPETRRPAEPVSGKTKPDIALLKNGTRAKP